MTATPDARLDALLPSGGLHIVFQPIVDLDAAAVVGYEALARGPVGTALARPVDLFAAAREADCLAELDGACRALAFRTAVESGRLSPLTLFVNVEPQVLDHAPLDELLQVADAAPRELRVVFEITERAIAARPAELLRTVERIRSHGWGVALDDVGADTASLAFMALLRPEVVKLDLRLIQQRPTPEAAAIMHAVNAYTEESGAALLAEGIENAAHLEAARALGARFGQGWLFGRPSREPSALPVADAGLPRFPSELSSDRSPFACLAPGTPLRRADKRLLIELSKVLEQEALTYGETAIITAAFQESRHFTARTAERYARLARHTAFVCAIGADLPREPAPGVRGAVIAPGDELGGEWDVIVITPHFAAALLARDAGDSGPELARRFDYALTYRRDAVVRAACALLARVVPAVDGAETRRLADAA